MHRIDLKKSLIFIPLLVFMMSVSLAGAHGDKHKKKEKTTPMAHHWESPAVEQERKNPVPATDLSVENGRALYLENCTQCHGDTADGDGPDAGDMEPAPTNLRAMSGHHPDGDLAWKIKTGKGPMPPWEDMFTEEQIWHLVNFIQDLKQPE